jgi:predicted site-specific integrase-resolvase
MSRRLVSEAELARRLGVSARTVSAMRKKGKLPAIIINRKNIRYDPAEVMATLKGEA